MLCAAGDTLIPVSDYALELFDTGAPKGGSARLRAPSPA